MAAPPKGRSASASTAPDYEIDLNTEHVQALAGHAGAPLALPARPAARPASPARGGRKASANGVNTTEVREWAKAQGMDVKDRGRYPPSWSSSVRFERSGN